MTRIPARARCPSPRINARCPWCSSSTREGNINDAGQHELIEFVLEAWEFAAKHKADDLLAFCTSAIREATNGPAVLARVKHETTVTLQELTGSEEASMTFFAVRRWYGWGAGPS